MFLSIKTSNTLQCSDFPCFSSRAMQFSLLLWQYKDHYSQNLKIPQITGYIALRVRFKISLIVTEGWLQKARFWVCIFLLPYSFRRRRILTSREFCSDDARRRAGQRAEQAEAPLGWKPGIIMIWRLMFMIKLSQYLSMELMWSRWQKSVTCGRHVPRLSHVYWWELVTWNMMTTWFIGNSCLWFIATHIFIG